MPLSLSKAYRHLAWRRCAAGVLNVIVFSQLACGPAKKHKQPGLVATESPTTMDESNHNQSKSNNILRDDVPVETFLLNRQAIPSKLKASGLVLKFRSNAPNAAIECSLSGSSGYKPCAKTDAGSVYQYDFGKLVDGRAYNLKVRASLAPGRRDKSPLSIAFVVDQQRGMVMDASQPGDANQVVTSLPASAAQLPTPFAASGQTSAVGTDSLEEAERSMQIGAYYSMAVPYGYLVTSFSTNRTYNGLVHLMRVLTPGLSGAYQSEACDKSWDVVTRGPANLPYCDETPTEEQLLASYAAPQPQNHLEIVRLTEHADQRIDGLDERLMVSTFTSPNDPAKKRLGLASVCARALSRGSSQVLALQDFYGDTLPLQTLSWCQIRDQAGVFWWVGSLEIDLRLAAAQTSSLQNQIENQIAGPQMVVIASARVDRSKSTGAAFAASVSQLLLNTMVAIIPVP